MDEIESQPESPDHRQRSRWWAIAVCGLLGVALAATLSVVATPTYMATATSIVQVNGGSGGASSVQDALSGSLFAQHRVKTYVDLVASGRVMDGVIEDLGLPLSPSQLAEKIDASNPDDTVNLEISATDANPALAQSIANATAEQLGDAVTALESPASGGESLVDMTVVTPAQLPTSPSSPRTALNIVIGLAIGVVIGSSLVLGLALRERRMRTEEPAA